MSSAAPSVPSQSRRVILAQSLLAAAEMMCSKVKGSRARGSENMVVMLQGFYWMSFLFVHMPFSLTPSFPSTACSSCVLNHGEQQGKLAPSPRTNGAMDADTNICSIAQQQKSPATRPGMWTAHNRDDVAFPGRTSAT